MKLKQKLILVLFFLFIFTAWQHVPNRPYVESDRIFYAKSIPEASIGWKGVTKIFKVEKDQDKLHRKINYYAPGGISICWSPISGEVSSVFLNHKLGREVGDKLELKFFKGSEHLKDYYTKDLEVLGVSGSFSKGRFANIKSIKCQQAKPGTNDYKFVLEGDKNFILEADILTGILKPSKVKVSK